MFKRTIRLLNHYQLWDTYYVVIYIIGQKFSPPEKKNRSQRELYVLENI